MTLICDNCGKEYEDPFCDVVLYAKGETYSFNKIVVNEKKLKLCPNCIKPAAYVAIYSRMLNQEGDNSENDILQQLLPLQTLQEEDLQDV